MTCSACGSQWPEGSGACPKCGYVAPGKAPVVASSQGAAAAPAPARFGSINDLQPPPPPAASAPPPSPQRRAMQLIGVILYGVVLIAPLVWLGISRSEGTLPYAIGEAIGRSLIPAIFVVVYFTRKKPPASSVRVLFWLMTWMFVGQLTALIKPPDVSEKDVPILMREAAGLAPIREPDNPARKAIRDVYRELLDSQRTYDADVKALQTPEGENLLQAASFASPETMQAELDHIQKMTTVETKQGESLDRFHERMFAAIDGLSWSQSKKDQFKQGLRSSFDRERPFRKRVLDSELAWFAAMTEVYQFSLERSDKIGVIMTSGGAEPKPASAQIVIHDDAVRAEFNQKIERAEELRKQFLEANAAFQQNVKTNEKKVGISRDELGLEPAK